MRRCLLTPLGLLVALSGSAWGQSEEDLATSITLEQTSIGIDNCSRWASEGFSVTGQIKRTESLAYTLRLTWSTGEACSQDSNDTCPGTGNGSGTDVECGCLRESTGTPTEVRDTDVTLRGLLGHYPCGADRPYTEVNFYLDFYQKVDGQADATRQTGPAATVAFDFERPAAPTGAPALSNAEKALRVSVDGVSDNDVASYEVCYRRATGLTTDSDAGVDGTTPTNDSLRAGFDACTSVDSGDRKTRIEGLDNGVVYEVVYAAIDAAGNRSANSPVATGTPAEVLDFAEHYAAVGGAEHGGCSASPTRGDLPLALIFLVGLVGLVRLRRHA